MDTPTPPPASPVAPAPAAPAAPADFIRAVVADDQRTRKYLGRVATRFPPEPNGYLHIGHAKSICLNFGIAQETPGARCNLRFDDTNPTKEDVEYAQAIERDVRWLGFDFGPRALYASDYFEQMFQYALVLIRAGHAYVCSLSDEQIREHRGALGVPGRPSPYRERSVAENLELFARMRAGEFPDGAHVLRARIDMAAANMKMRDPLLYRIRKHAHDRTGDAWCIYPMYDYAHPLSDSIEGITHSICTLEFENNRELYDWVLVHTGVPWRPQQLEFARLNLDYALMSKRKLLLLVEQGLVKGWDDPRMPTLAGMRRRGYSPEALRTFANLVGVSKHNSVVDLGKLEYCVRDDLNHTAPRAMAVLRPLRVVLTNFPEYRVDALAAPSFPPDVGKPGTRDVPFARELWIERDDFHETPPKDYLRLAPGRTVRLRYAYCVRCDEVVKDPATGEVTELRCSVHLDTLTGQNPAGEKVWGVLHWVSAAHALPAEVRLYDRLFTAPRPEADESREFTEFLNPESLVTLRDCRVEPSLAHAAPGARFQFERLGYFCADSEDSRPGSLVFNRVVTLRDTWANAARAPAATEAPSSTPEAPAGDAKPKSRPGRKTQAHVRANARLADPELSARMALYVETLGLSEEQADLLSADRATSDLFESARALHPQPASLARWIIHELPRELGEGALADAKLTAANLAAFVALVDAGTVSGPMAREVFALVVRDGAAPGDVVARGGLSAVTDPGAIAQLVDAVVAQNPDKVAAYRAGRTGLLGFFVGQVMKASRGQADPAQLDAALKARLA